MDEGMCCLGFSFHGAKGMEAVTVSLLLAHVGKRMRWEIPAVKVLLWLRHLASL